MNLQVNTMFLSSYIFISGLFNDDVSNSNSTASNDFMTANNELKKMWKKTVVA
jgi:hypothetical protein